MRTWNHLSTVFFIGSLVLATESQAQTHEDSLGAYKALRHYESLVARMESDSIASLFAADGQLMKSKSESLVGPAAVRSFLQSFSTYHVLQHRMDCDSLFFSGSRVVQSGTYWQKVRIPSGDTLTVDGRFQLEWQRSPNDIWRILRIRTVPTTK